MEVSRLQGGCIERFSKTVTEAVRDRRSRHMGCSGQVAQRPAITLVVLDVGGTIIEDRGDVPEAVRSAMAHHGIRSSSEEIGRRRNASKREVISHFVDQQSPPRNVDRRKLIAAIHDEFTANLIKIYQSVPPIAGAGEAIRELRASGYLVATTTGFDRRITTSIFQRLGWEGNFVATICSDDVAQGHPAPFMIFHAMESARVSSVAEVVAVGDTPLDMQAGTNAGVRAVVGVSPALQRLRISGKSPTLYPVQRGASPGVAVEALTASATVFRIDLKLTFSS